MATEFESMLFEEELASLDELPEARRWTVERDKEVPLGITTLIHSIKDPTELYLARLRWPDYFKPVSLKFLSRMTGSDTDATAWPIVRGFRPTSLDTCVSYTLEGHALHPEWANSPSAAFPKIDRPMRYALLRLQSEMDMYYERRWGT
jgi:hypothetical protein